MPDSPTLSVHIWFATPTGNRHRRVVREFPRPVARQMVRDFEAHEDPKTEISAHQLYRFGGEGEGDERLAALDFREVRAIGTREPQDSQDPSESSPGEG